MSESMKCKSHIVNTSGGIAIHVRSRGEDRKGPVVLLLHGFGVGSGYWDLPIAGYNTMDYLAQQGISAYAMDHRGYGGSGRVSGASVTMANAREDVLAVIDWVKARSSGRPIGLVGHSFGGSVAIAVAARSLDISCLVTIGTSFRRLHPTFAERLAVTRALAAVDGWIANKHHVGLDQRLFAYDEKVLRAYQNLIESEYPRVPLGIIEDSSTLPLPHSAAVAELRLPTRVICGTLEQVVDRGDCLDLLDAIPAAEKDLLLVGNSGHLMGLEKLSHSHVDRAIAAWLFDHASSNSAAIAAA